MRSSLLELLWLPDLALNLTISCDLVRMASPTKVGPLRLEVMNQLLLNVTLSLDFHLLAVDFDLRSLSVLCDGVTGVPP